jgi:aldehyde dehydrogenase (NAD+)
VNIRDTRHSRHSIATLIDLPLYKLYNPLSILHFLLEEFMKQRYSEILKACGIKSTNSGACYGKWIKSPSGGELDVFTPIDGSKLATVQMAGPDDYDLVMEKAQAAFLKWRMLPAPKRGEVIRQLGNALREKKTELGALVTLEMGKIAAEGQGEVQEMIDICDFAVGLSRQLYGLTMHSERPGHRMYEQWHPMGTIGIISAFNFPVAVWAWNSAIAAVCGDSMIWKPSSETPLTAIAIQHICNDLMKTHDLEGLFGLVVGRGGVIGEKLIADKRIPLVSATGSCEMGYRIGEVVGKRLGRTILELGGNNAIIVMDDANLQLAMRAILFGSVGTAAQRCTSTRRIIVHEKVYDRLLETLSRAYKTIPIGNPLDECTLMGPLVNASALETMQAAIKRIKKAGGKIICGGEPITVKGYEGGHYVKPCIAEAENDWDIVQEETFAPILYAMKCSSIDEGIAIQNNVAQGLSSACFTTNMLSGEAFLSARGSDCGIANLNIGTSGAEIGGAFGGEKETGGGREAGSDSWKAYMRRQTNTINWSTELPLAQGISFDL